MIVTASLRKDYILVKVTGEEEKAEDQSFLLLIRYE